MRDDVQALVASMRKLGKCRIAFNVKRDDYTDSPTEIHVVKPDGADERNLTRTPRLYEWSPVWSPDGGRLAFSATRTYGPALQIFVINADGSGLKQLTRRSRDGDYSYMGTWSRDGRHIKYERTVGGNVENTAIWMMSANGSGKRRLKGPRALGSPSPDGRWFVGTRDSGVSSGIYGSPDVFLISVDGRKRRWLTHSGDIADVDWSPDGRKILYTRVDVSDGAAAGLYVINADGSGRSRLTRGKGEFHSATWSPDGRLILFSQGGEIYVTAADGTRERRLTHGGPGSWNSSPTWSHDGQRIAFTRGIEIWAMNRDGSGIHRVTRPRGEAVHSSAAWSPSCP